MCTFTQNKLTLHNFTTKHHFWVSVSSKHSDIQRATQPVTLWLGLAFHGQEFTCLDGLLSIRVLYSDKFIHCTGSTMLSLNTQSSEHACVHGQWDMLICCWKEGHCLCMIVHEMLTHTITVKNHVYCLMPLKQCEYSDTLYQISMHLDSDFAVCPPLGVIKVDEVCHQSHFRHWCHQISVESKVLC